jgi:hypothetical protein
MLWAPALRESFNSPYASISRTPDRHPRVRIDFVAAWQKKEPSIALKSFLDLLDEELPAIREKMRYIYDLV